jgi:hypothetical protein
MRKRAGSILKNKDWVILQYVPIVEIHRKSIVIRTGKPSNVPIAKNSFQ